MNKSAQFTPGPWHLEHDVDGIPLTVIGSDGSAIGTVETWNDCTEGNRLVLTAAPAMYAELVNGLGLLEASYHDMCDKYGKDSMQAEVVWDQVERTRNVIAQAEGSNHA